MKNLLLTSTGTMVGRSNGYDYKRALREIYTLCENGLSDGLELMMLGFYYDKKEAVTDAVRSSGVPACVIHCEKEIGAMLSDAASLFALGRRDEADALCSEALELFRLNCAFGESLMIDRMVLHLWGGRKSDGHIGYNIEKFDGLKKIAAEHGIRLLVENIPSSTADPRSNWHKLMPRMDGAGFIFDTRFGKLHEQSADILTDSVLTPLIEHIHVSDFKGGYRDFAALRPIFHPGDGMIDFDEIFTLLRGIGYSGSVTLESPIMEGEGLNTTKIARTLEFLRHNLKNS